MISNRVLFVAPMNTKGGIGAVLDLYAQQFNSFEVLYTYPENKSVSRFPFYLKALYNLIQKLWSDPSIDIVHIHTASNGSFYRKSIALLIAKTHAKKTIMHIHGGGFKEFYNSSLLKNIFIKPILKSADQVICLSDVWYEYFSKQLQLKNAVVLPNPIAMPHNQVKEKITNRIELIYFGAVVSTKGIFDLVNYLTTNRYFIEGKILLHVCGEGDLEKLRSIVELHQIYEQVIIHGWISGSTKSKLFQQADVFILPSFAEGLPMSILEAMSFGKPIIATNVGGVPSLVHPQYNGWLYAPNKIQDLTQVFEELFSNLDLLKVYGQNSRKMSLPYDIQNVTQKLQHIYTNVLSK
jgi:glycosyltransferase involved in cell wall biosynthesis